MTMAYRFPVLKDEFKDKRILITGGTKGMEEAMVRRFMLGGASVVTTARSPLPADQKPALFVQADLGTQEGVREVAGRILQEWWQDGSSCAMDQNLAQIDVAPLTDAEQLRLASGGILPRQDAEPCSEISPLTESSSVADSRDDGCRHDRSDTWDLANPSATCVCSGDPLQLRGEFFDLLFNSLPVF
jgi:hypothetical protein